MSLVHITQVQDAPRLRVVDWDLGEELEDLVRQHAPGGTVHVMVYGRGFNAPAPTVAEVREKVGDRADEVITLHINANSWENDGKDRRILDARVLTADSPEAGGGIQTTDEALFHEFQRQLLKLTKQAAERTGGAVPMAGASTPVVPQSAEVRRFPHMSVRLGGILGGAAALVTVVTGIVALWPGGDEKPRSRASAIRECMADHGLQKATGVVTAEAAGTRVFGNCDWPPTTWAQPDGYSEVVVREARGPGENEASGTTAADRVFAPCSELQAAYSFGKQGAFRRQAPITLLSGEIVTVDGLRWSGEQRDLPFYPDRDESIVLRNFSYRIDYARCIG